MKITTPAAASALSRLGAALVCLLIAAGCETLKPRLPQVGPLLPPVAPSLPPSEIAVRAIAHVDLEERGRDLPTYLVDTQHFDAAHPLGLWSIAGDATSQAWLQDNGLHIGVGADGLELGVKAHYTVNVRVTHLFPLIGCDLSSCYAQCGWDDELPLAAEMKATAKPRWLKEWKATANVTVSAHSEQCLLTAHEIDKTDLIEGAIRRVVEKAAGERVKVIEKKADIHDKAKGWWEALSKPQPMDSEQRVLLALNPRSAFVSRITGSDQPDSQLSMVAGIVAEPHAYVGAVPGNLPAPTPFPELAVDVDHAPEGTIALALPVDVTLDEFNALANRPAPDGLVGEYADVGKLRATITHVGLQPLDGGSVAFTVGLKGGPRRPAYEPIKSPFALFRNIGRAVEHGFLLWATSFTGDVLLTGAPRFAAQENAIRFDRVGFEPQNWNLVYIYASWVARSRLLALLQEKAVIPVAPHTARARERLNAVLNRKFDDGSTLSGSVTDISLTNLVVAPTAISGYFVVQGTAQLETVIR